MNIKLFDRLLDVIEHDIAPLTERAVETGSRVFGAAVLRASDHSLVLAETNHAAFSPLWHAEVYTIKLFYELQGHPAAEDCLFLATHRPCCMCTSALAWAGFRRIYYLFGFESTEKDFAMPHDLRMNREIFGCDAPTLKNAYFEMHSLEDFAAGTPERSSELLPDGRIGRLTALYDNLARRVAERESGAIPV
ncbi:MAG: nucleoside deaminase [Fretibacterium sp.]|nr:nucleoside deaminase [Fretibacterium sp.]